MISCALCIGQTYSVSLDFQKGTRLAQGQWDVLKRGNSSMSSWESKVAPVWGHRSATGCRDVTVRLHEIIVLNLLRTSSVIFCPARFIVEHYLVTVKLKYCEYTLLCMTFSLSLVQLP